MSKAQKREIAEFSALNDHVALGVKYLLSVYVEVFFDTAVKAKSQAFPLTQGWHNLIFPRV